MFKYLLTSPLFFTCCIYGVQISQPNHSATTFGQCLREEQAKLDCDWDADGSHRIHRINHRFMFGSDQRLEEGLCSELEIDRTKIERKT